MSDKTVGKRTTQTTLEGKQIPLRERRMDVKNRLVTVDPEELNVDYDLTPILKDRVLTTGRNLLFTDRKTARQYWIEYDGEDTIEYVVTDSVGVRMDSKLVTTTSSKEKRKSCFICSGGGKDPKTYQKIDCSTILILTDEEMAQPDK